MAEQLIDYGAWGRTFFTTVVTTERVVAGVNVMADRPIDVGPLGVGPGRLVKVRASGRIGTATGHRITGEPLRYDVRLPVSLTFVLGLGVDRQRFDAEIEVPLLITARARADLAVVLEVAPPATDDVAVHLRARSRRASLTNRAADVEGELRRFVARYVARELEGPAVRAATVIDVAGAVDRAAGALTAGGPSPVAEAVASDLPAAMAEADLQGLGELAQDAASAPAPPD
ncbi:hypothetical protein [Nocardioides sp.]|uniref:hypothetical protein n=1 Tax=Nocardioides sp. TaxID=35761 RepID=UPI0035159718